MQSGLVDTAENHICDYLPAAAAVVFLLVSKCALTLTQAGSIQVVCSGRSGELYGRTVEGQIDCGMESRVYLLFHNQLQAWYLSPRIVRGISGSSRSLSRDLYGKLHDGLSECLRFTHYAVSGKMTTRSPAVIGGYLTSLVDGSDRAGFNSHTLCRTPLRFLGTTSIATDQYPLPMSVHMKAALILTMLLGKRSIVCRCL